jgi:hypothetical protein
MAMMVVLLEDADREFRLGEELVASLAQLGVTSLDLVRDTHTVGVVLEGWLFDAARSAGVAAETVRAGSEARVLHPIMHLAVSAAPDAGGRDVEQVS